ncbi:hypothetical protein ACHAXT_012565 [Thalassiosira profunda]
MMSRVLFSLCLIRGALSWSEWTNATSFTTDDWRELWLLGEGPNERRGHSLVLFNESKVILFGGRGNDAHRPHVPRHFDLVEEGGVLEFATHDGKPLSDIYSPDSPLCQPVETCHPLTNARSGNAEVCSQSWDHLLQGDPTATEQAKVEETCGFVPVGVHYNDVWVYDTDCLRFGDLACANDGWRILHPGIKFGGCNTEDGVLVCASPSERYGHGAAMLDDTTMAVYGGHSHECEDYCDDLWLFDLLSLEWSKVESTPSPGNRHDFSFVSDSTTNTAYLFGGHRLWHGFSDDNSVDNRWQSTAELPKGGYLNDLWAFGADPANADEKQWSQIEGKTTCVDAPGLTWESRNDQHCQLHWPSARSGHAAVFDEKRGGLWVHGGFSTYYPYPTSKDAGSGPGTQTLGRDHAPLTPTHSFYLDDLWFFDAKKGFWQKKRICETKMTCDINIALSFCPLTFTPILSFVTVGRKPQRRTDHTLSLSGDLLILHGGFGDNFNFKDTWHYLIDENRWVEKDAFVHAEFPDTCIDSLLAVEQDPSCIELEFPDDLKRSNESTLALKYQEILPFSEQKGYTPDPAYPMYFGIVDDAEAFVEELRQKYLEQEVYDEKGQRIWLESTVPDGTPIAPKAATAPRQYARQRRLRYNATTELDVWEWCASVKGEPTRDREDDGKFGRSNTSVFIPQPRRQSPGWDGCRDFQWTHPPSRADHASVYVAKHDMLVTHGGVGYGPEEDSHPTHPVNDRSPATRVLGDFWVLNMHNCARNCSGHGVCTNGFCECDPGFYGVDCSNVTCPGSVCAYDANNNQHCAHCCYDTIEGDLKVPCRLDDDELMLFTGQSEGICDGFGTCQCAPPYIGEDCSIVDCKHNCSFNGYCSVQFPQSRCMCKDGYTGEYCQHMECLNNCSYPNGQCDQETGVCSCQKLYNPYNRTQAWSRWQGDDCSYLPAFSASNVRGLFVALSAIALGSLGLIT